MGDPLEDEVPYGTDCPSCTPGTWAPGKTPLFLFCKISGIAKCLPFPPLIPEPPAGGIFLTQAAPCLWQFFTPGFTFSFQIGPTISLFVANWGPFLYYMGAAPLCSGSTINGLTCQPAFPLRVGTGGTAVVAMSGSKGLASYLAFKLNLSPRPSGKSEYHYNADAQEYVTLANWRDRTNCLVKYDFREFPL